MNKLEAFFGLKEGIISSMLVDFGIRIAIALVILVIGFWLAKVLTKSLKKIFEKRNIEKSLSTFLVSLTGILVKTLIIVTAITQLGIEMTSFVAILGAAGLAIGMAFSGTLSNFAGGVMILIFKPYKVGDYVEMQGEEGIVDEILIFNTILKTLDHKTIIMANGAIANGTIVNYTKAGIRRVDWSFGISYGDDLATAKKVLAKFISEDERILQDQENFIGLGELGDSSVNITARAWVKVNDYWPVFFDMNERVYTEFPKSGLSIPFPQMDVHVYKRGKKD
ncbi:MAG: mechanosensitive ion channel [Bacteroidetes bacterium]|nr:MAG: mechanosensitive ion channel [Bacteroidota bacterium]